MLAIVERTRVSSHESAWPAAMPAPRTDPEHLAKLERWVRAPTTSQRVVTRSLIALLASAGHPVAHIAAELGVTRRTVSLWRRRFAAGGPDALLADAPGRGRKKGRNPASVSRILAASRETPPGGAARWTVRSLARHVGVSHATVHRVWSEHGLGNVHEAAPAIPETPREEDCA